MNYLYTRAVSVVIPGCLQMVSETGKSCPLRSRSHIFATYSSSTREPFTFGAESVLPEMGSFRVTSIPPVPVSPVPYVLYVIIVVVTIVPTGILFRYDNTNWQPTNPGTILSDPCQPPKPDFHLILTISSRHAIPQGSYHHLHGALPCRQT